MQTVSDIMAKKLTILGLVSNILNPVLWVICLPYEILDPGSDWKSRVSSSILVLISWFQFWCSNYSCHVIEKSCSSVEESSSIIEKKLWFVEKRCDLYKKVAINSKKVKICRKNLKYWGKKLCFAEESGHIGKKSCAL